MMNWSRSAPYSGLSKQATLRPVASMRSSQARRRSFMLPKNSRSIGRSSSGIGSAGSRYGA